MLKVLRNFWSGEEGATAVEYGLMVALIAGTIVATVTALGIGVNAVFTTVEAAISGAGAAA